jgi:hypothetical protein
LPPFVRDLTLPPLKINKSRKNPFRSTQWI